VLGLKIIWGTAILKGYFTVFLSSCMQTTCYHNTLKSLLVVILTTHLMQTQHQSKLMKAELTTGKLNITHYRTKIWHNRKI